MKQQAILVATIAWVALVSGDDFPHYGTTPIVAGNDTHLVTHWHDWGARIDLVTESDDTRLRLSRNPDEIFDPKRNRYSFLVLIDKKGNRTLFTKPVPALSYLWISPDSRYIVGLSNVKLYNPYQIVVLSGDGQLLHREHIAAQEAVVSKAELAELLRTVPSARPHLADRVVFDGAKAQVDYFGIWLDPELWPVFVAPLEARLRRHHYSPNFAESVTNYIHWYDEERPGVSATRSEEGELCISLRDPKGKPFTIMARKKQRRKARKMD